MEAVVLDDPFDAAGADGPSALAELLSDGRGRGIGVEEAVSEHLVEWLEEWSSTSSIMTHLLCPGYGAQRTGADCRSYGGGSHLNYGGRSRECDLRLHILRPHIALYSPLAAIIK